MNANAIHLQNIISFITTLSYGVVSGKTPERKKAIVMKLALTSKNV
jgi:hypothetical protein